MNTELSKRQTLATLAAAGLGGSVPPAATAQKRPAPEGRTSHPDFFAQVPTIVMHDPLAEFLGASAQGRIEFTYWDAVKLTGHSCAVVASAYLLALNGLGRLYGDQIPVRGDIRIAIRNERSEGTTGVTASVLTLITGAATETGFNGIGKGRRFLRRDLLTYEQKMDDFLTMSRADTGKSVSLSFDLDAVPFDAAMQDLFPQAVAGALSEDDQERFAALWQDRIRRMLLEHATDPALIQIRDL